MSSCGQTHKFTILRCLAVVNYENLVNNELLMANIIKCVYFHDLSKVSMCSSEMF